MRVPQLYIVGWANTPDDAEVERVSGGLFTNHLNKTSVAAYITATVPAGSETPSETKLKKLKGDIPLTSTVTRAGAETFPATEGALQSSKADRAIGMYIISHGGKNLSGTLAKIPVNLISAVVPEESLRSISKIVLLGCSLAFGASFAERDAEISLNDDKDLGQMSFMVGCVKLLGERGIKPIVAGYDEFVTAFPMVGSVYKPETARNQPNTSLRQLAPAVAGKKIIQLRPPETTAASGAKTTVDAAYRTAHKKYYRVEEGGAVRFSTHPASQEIDWSALWTDK